MRKTAQYMADILEPGDKDKLYENLLVGSNKVSVLIRIEKVIILCQGSNCNSDAIMTAWFLCLN